MKLFHKLFLAGLLFGGQGLYLGAGQENEWARIELEKKITEELTKDLEKILPPSQFAVFTDLSFTTSDEKTLTEQEQYNSSHNSGGKNNEEAPAKVEVEQLPGFSPPIPEVPAGKESVDLQEKIEQTREKYRINKEMIIDSVKVTLVVNKSIAPEKKELVTSIVQDKVSASYRDKGTVSVLDADFTEGRLSALPSDAESKAQDPLQQLKEALPKGVSLPIFFAAIAGGILLLLILMLLIRRKTPPPTPDQTPKRRATDEPNEENAAGEKGGKVPGPTSDEVMQANLRTIDELLELINKNPLVSRKFLQKSLPPERQAIFSNLHTNATKEIFAKLFGDDLPAIEQSIAKANSKYQRNDLAKVVNSLRQYIHVQSIFEQRKFGFLHFIIGNELNQAAKELSPTEQGMLIPFLSSQQCQHFLSQIAAEERAKLIEFMMEPPAHTPEELNSLDEKLRALFSRNVEEIFTSSARELSPVQLLLENDPDIEAIAGLLKSSEKFGQHQELNKYLITLDDILNLEPEKLKNILNRVENEDIAHAFEEKPKETLDKVLASLTSVRRQIVDNLLQHHSDDKTKIMAAQSKILKAYRSAQKENK